MALALPLVLAVTALYAQQQGTLRNLGRLRSAAGRDARFIRTVPVGTKVAVFEDERGWRRVQLEDGSEGWLWGEHIELQPGEAAAAPPPAAEATTPSSLPPPADDVRALRAEIDALRQRGSGPTTAEIEQLRAEVRALAAAQRDLEQRLGERPHEQPLAEPIAVPDGAPPVDGGMGIAAALVIAGGALGWLVSRLAQRRRDRRQRIRI